MRSRRSSRKRSESEIDKTKVFRKSDVKKPGIRWQSVLGVVLAVGLLFGAGALVAVLRSISVPPIGLIPDELLETYEGRINILILGIDAGVNGNTSKPRPGTGRSDVMMLASIDEITKEAGLLWIPRDTRVYIAGSINDYDKAGHAYAYGGPALSVQTMQEALKVDIHHYIRVDFEAFKKAVDILGGVTIDVPPGMTYEDPYQDLYIHLEEGRQVLNGEQALGFVRFRSYRDADIARIEAQKKFIAALMDKALSMSSILKVPEIIKEIKPYVKTDLTDADALYLANIARGIKSGNVSMGTIPGGPKDLTDGERTVSYWIPDSASTAKMVDELVRGISRDKNETVKVAIENGCGVRGAADALATVLQDLGFDVVSVGNASKSDYAATRVVADSNAKDKQVLVFNSVKRLSPEVKAYNSAKIPEGADVLVIVGKDYNMPGS